MIQPTNTDQKKMGFVRSSIFLGLSLLAFSGVTPRASAQAIGQAIKSETHQTIDVPIEEIHPTQFSVGQIAVDEISERMSQVRATDPLTFQAWIERGKPRAVRGPQGKIYLIDGHHNVRAALDLNLRSFRLTIAHDWSNLSEPDFWRKMLDSGYVHLKGPDGKPRLHTQLPRKMADLADDPFRTLADWLKESGRIGRSQFPFAELHWADALRKIVPKHLIHPSTRQQAVEATAAFTSSKSAAHLPGYIEPLVTRPTAFIFDLDDTLIRYLRAGESAEGKLIPVQANGHTYRVLDGAIEMIASLVKDYPDVPVLFYSAGKEDRNREVLSKIHLPPPDGRSLLDIAQGQVYSEGDIHFQNGKKLKNLAKILPQGVSLDGAVLIDDSLEGRFPAQEDHLLHIGNRPALHPSRTGGESFSAEDFVRYRNKLARARGLIDRAARVARERGLSFSKAMAEIQRDPNTFSDIDLYRQGALRFRSANPDYRFTSATGERIPIRCLRMRFSELLGSESP